MKSIRKLISSSENHFMYFIYQNTYINKENLIIAILPIIYYTIATNRDNQESHKFNTKRHIITFSWLMFNITIDYCYKINK